MEIELKNITEAEKAALADEYDKALSFCADESAEYSLSHYKKMRRIVGERLAPSVGIRKQRRRLAAVLIAAAMLFALVGCTVAVYKEQIGAFFTEIFEEHIKGSFTEEDDFNNQFIDEYYTLTYVPEGYELIESRPGELLSTTVWQKADGAQLIFEQTPINSTYYFINNESGTTYVIEAGKYAVYFRSIEGTYTYIWNNEEYAFALYFDIEISEEEIVKIIGELKPLEK